MSPKTQSLERAKKRQHNPASSIVRASLGGAIMGLVMLVASAVSYKSRIGYVPYPHLFIMPGLPLAIGFGALLGAFIAVVIWVSSAVRGRALGVAARALIGLMTALAVIGLYSYFQTETPGVYYEPGSVSQIAVFWLMNSAMGVLPGVMAAQKPKLTQSDTENNW